MKLTTLLHTLPRLGMSGDILPLSPCAFIPWAVATLPSTQKPLHLGRTLPFGFLLTVKSYDVLQFRSNFEKILRIADFGFIHLDNLTYDNVRVSSETKV
jgi:hypothetical protein